MSSYKYIVKLGDHYLTPRRATGIQYESRSQWSVYMEDARIFNTRQAASNSANKVSDKFKPSDCVDLKPVVKRVEIMELDD